MIDPKTAESAEETVEEEIAHRVAQIRSVHRQVRRVIIGQDELILHVLTCVFCGGHALLEGIPGLGKTRLIRSVARSLALDTMRVQCTPDLMPADIIGTNTLLQDEAGHQSIEFQRGPIFTQILLADEVNRATPKTQSALLEAMQEHQVTVGGTTYPLGPPFVVLATQNPLELEGTYPLPEAQLDRFFLKLRVRLPQPDQMMEIVRRTTGNELIDIEPVIGVEDIAAIQSLVREVVAEEWVRRYVVDLVYATHPDNEAAPEVVTHYVRYGASPRGAQSLLLAAKFSALLAGRLHVAPEDFSDIIAPSLRHRIVLGFRAEAEGLSVERVIEAITEEVTPR